MNQNYANSFGGHSDRLDAEPIKKALNSVGIETPLSDIWDKIKVVKDEKHLGWIDLKGKYFMWYEGGKSTMYDWNNVDAYINFVTKKTK
jgi:hypothetical protein